MTSSVLLRLAGGSCRTNSCGAGSCCVSPSYDALAIGLAVAEATRVLELAACTDFVDAAATPAYSVRVRFFGGSSFGNGCSNFGTAAAAALFSSRRCVRVPPWLCVWWAYAWRAAVIIAASEQRPCRLS